MAVEPSSEKKTFANLGFARPADDCGRRIQFFPLRTPHSALRTNPPAFTSLSASRLAGSLAKPSAEEWAIFSSCRFIAALIFG